MDLTTSLYLSDIYDEKSLYPKIEIGFAFKPLLNDVTVKLFNDQTFKRDGEGSAILKKHDNPSDLIFQHLSVKEKVKNITDVNILQNVFIKDTITSVDLQENAKNGVKVIQIFESFFIEKTLR